MGRYIIRRILEAIPLLFLFSLFMFLLIHALPGGPVQALVNPRMTAAARAALIVKFGLNDPLPVQYIKWISHMVTGDFGFSFVTFQPVGTVLTATFPYTLELFSAAFALAIILAILIGMFSALRQGSAVDYSLTTLSYFGIAMPIFLFGLLAQDFFAVKLHFLPVSGTSTPGYVFDPFNALLDHIIHLILPVLVLAISFVAGWSRYIRSSMIDVAKQDYIRTARAKGVPPVRILTQHALRNALIPFITVVALDFGQIAGGAAVTETVFSWPGMGTLFIGSLEASDYPVLMAILLMAGILVVLFNLLADILYAVTDPRIRYA